MSHLSRREFLHVLAIASAGGFALDANDAFASPTSSADASRLYDLPRFGNVHFLHMTDCHAQLLPSYFREPNVNLGLHDASGRPPHLVGENLLKHFGIARGSAQAPWRYLATA